MVSTFGHKRVSRNSLQHNIDPVSKATSLKRWYLWMKSHDVARHNAVWCYLFLRILQNESWFFWLFSLLLILLFTSNNLEKFLLLTNKNDYIIRLTSSLEAAKLNSKGKKIPVVSTSTTLFKSYCPCKKKAHLSFPKHNKFIPAPPFGSHCKQWRSKA